MNVSIVVVPREKVSMSVPMLESIWPTIDDNDQVIIQLYDGKELRDSDILDKFANRENTKILLHNEFKTPNGLRQNAIQYVKNEWVVFCDNDVDFRPDWLTELKKRMDEDDVEVICPLIFIGPPFYEFIHHAGGHLYTDGQIVSDAHRLSNQHISSLKVRNSLGSEEYRYCDSGEFHCIAVKKTAFDKGVILPEVMITRDHLDFALQCRELEIKVGFCAKSWVMYQAKTPFTKVDLKYHIQRWDHERVEASVSYIKQKWGVDCRFYYPIEKWVRFHRELPFTFNSNRYTRFLMKLVPRPIRRLFWQIVDGCAP